METAIKMWWAINLKSRNRAGNSSERHGEEALVGELSRCINSSDWL